MTNKKKLIAAALVPVMVLAMTQMTAFAEENTAEEPTDTEDTATIKTKAVLAIITITAAVILHIFIKMATAHINSKTQGTKISFPAIFLSFITNQAPFRHMQHRFCLHSCRSSCLQALQRSSAPATAPVCPSLHPYSLWLHWHIRQRQL